MGINPSFAAAYFDTGTIYDVLAYAFFWGGFALYVRFRHAGRPLGWGRLALVFGLFVAALDAKEIAVSLPVALGLYELIWHPPANWKLAELWRWIRQEGRFALIGGFADVAYVAGKRYGPDSLWQEGPYHPQYSVAAYFQSLSRYVCQLIYKPVTISSSWQIAGLLAAMLVVAALARRRCLLWGVGFIAVGVLPLAFIPGRGGFAYLVPSVGCAVYACGLSGWLLEWLTGRRVRLRRAAQVVLFAALVIIVARWQRTWIEMSSHAAHDMQGRFRKYIDQIHALIPAPRKGARILLLSDAEGRDDYDVFFVTRLYYGDPKLDVERMTVWRQHNVHVDLSSYDYVLDWVDNRFVLAGGKSAPSPVQPGIYDDFDPAIAFHGTWIRDRVWPQTHAHTVTYCNVPGSEIQFAFQGDTLTYIYTKAANRGRADVSTDGARKAILDLYSPITQWQSGTVFRDLGRGRHLAVITVLPDKNPKSSDRWIDVDAFEVR